MSSGDTYPAAYIDKPSRLQRARALAERVVSGAGREEQYGDEIEARLHEVRAQSDQNPSMKKLSDALKVLTKRQAKEGIRVDQTPQLKHGEDGESANATGASLHTSVVLAMPHIEVLNREHALEARVTEPFLGVEGNNEPLGRWWSASVIMAITISRDTDLDLIADSSEDVFTVHIVTDSDYNRPPRPAIRHYGDHTLRIGINASGDLVGTEDSFQRDQMGQPMFKPSDPIELHPRMTEAYIDQISATIQANAKPSR